MTVILWQRMRDSNPRKRSQSPVCYRYTNPLCVKHGYYYSEQHEKVKNFFPFFASFFDTRSVCPFLWRLYREHMRFLAANNRPYKVE